MLRRLLAIAIVVIAIVLPIQVMGRQFSGLPAPRGDQTIQSAVIYSQVFSGNGAHVVNTWTYTGSKKFMVKTVRIWMGSDTSLFADLFAIVTRNSDGSIFQQCSLDHYAQFTGPHYCETQMPDGFVLDPGDSLHIDTSATPVQGSGNAHTFIIVWGVYAR